MPTDGLAKISLQYDANSRVTSLPHFLSMAGAERKILPEERN